MKFQGHFSSQFPHLEVNTFTIIQYFTLISFRLFEVNIFKILKFYLKKKFGRSLGVIWKKNNNNIKVQR